MVESVSTLTLPARQVTPAPILAGCRVILTDLDNIEWALKQLKKLCGKAGRKPGRWSVPGRDYHETRAQRARRKVGAAINRRERVHKDP